MAKNDKTEPAADESSGSSASKEIVTDEPAEFPVSLEEFLSEIPVTRVEMKAGFTHLCRAERIAGRQLRAEWQKLFTLFETMPTKSTWGEWQKSGGK